MPTLVVGAAGFVGQQIALALQRRTGQVRGFVRGGPSNPKAAALVAAGVEIASGDLTRSDTLGDACAGIDTVICTATTMPAAADDGLRKVDHEGVLALIDTADRAGVKRFVYTSYTGNVRVDCPLHTAKRECEARLLNSHVATVILRPSYFNGSVAQPCSRRRSAARDRANLRRRPRKSELHLGSECRTAWRRVEVGRGLCE